MPLSREEVQKIEKDRARKDTRLLYALNDDNGLFLNGPTTREDLLEQVEQYRYSDVGALVFAPACGDLVNYPSKIGRPWFADDSDGSIGGYDICHTANKGVEKRGYRVPVMLHLYSGG